MQKKRKLAQKIFPKPEGYQVDGCAVTTYDKDVNLSDLKSQLKEIVDNLAANWDETTKSEILRESKVVFELNNELVRSIKTSNESFKLVGYIFLFIFTIIFFIVMWHL